MIRKKEIDKEINRWVSKQVNKSIKEYMDFGVSKRDKWRQLKFWRENTDEDRYVSVFPFHLYENLSSSISNPDPRTANADRFKRSDSSCGGRREEERRNKGDRTEEKGGGEKK